jgi:hypothetical protein
VLIIIFEATAKQALAILFSQQHKCSTVSGYFKRQSWKMKFLSVLLIIFFIDASNSLSAQQYVVSKMDSTEGLFFYEVNAPVKCFTRFDQIEQSNNIVFFAENISSVQIDELYSKGIFYYSYPAAISNIS